MNRTDVLSPPNSLIAQLVDVHQRQIMPARLEWLEGRITAIRPVRTAPDQFVMPGFVDAHVHIESSMLVPSEFAREAVVHGTVATVSDPHEIANVLGAEGIEFMLKDAANLPMAIHFGVPSCVPATEFETAGARLDASLVARLLDDPRLGYLSEMMDYPGVLAGRQQVIQKIAAAQSRGKPVDGHAPRLRGSRAQQYFSAGISTDHECTSEAEAREKLALGTWIQIRQGSAARNLDALWKILDRHADRCMLCTDDLHPDDFERSHIDGLVRDLVTRGCDRFGVLQAACVNPVRHYGLETGLLRVGDRADFIVVRDLDSFQVLQTVIGGEPVAREGNCLWSSRAPASPNCFRTGTVALDAFRVPAVATQLRVIEARDGDLMTDGTTDAALIEDGSALADPRRDLLKIAVTNRYHDAAPAVAFIRNFGLREGAIASSVAHDSHNIVAVGASDQALCAATNAVIEMRGGLAAVRGEQRRTLALPVAGLMSTEPCSHVAASYAQLSQFARDLGSRLRAPFMTLSFMALLVIPRLKLSDQGLFDCDRFELVSLWL